MEDFKQYLSDDADERERAAAEQVRQGMEGLRLEAKLRAVAEERRIWLRRKFWWWSTAGALLLATTGTVYFYFGRNRAPVSPGKTEQPTPPSLQPVPQPLPKQLAKEPVAERPSTPRERAERPMVRGVQPELDTATRRLINVLLKMTATNNPSTDPSYNQQLHNQGSDWGNALRALRKRRPADAKKSIFILDKEDPREALWLLGIALLEEGNVDEAKTVFERISKDSQAYRRRDAVVVVEALR
jgi:hypothetical protein